MMRFYLLALVCAAVCQSSTAQGTQPDFCSLECPPFQVDLARTTDDYEVRRYQNAKWASTTVTDVSLTTAGSRGFRRLFNYIAGGNDDGVKIDMTVPVLTKIPKETSWWFFRDYTISFLLPQEHWANPPAPTSSDVFIEDMPEMVAYVTWYGGWSNGWNADSNYRAMTEKIRENGDSFDDNFYYTAQYDEPWKMTNRHNEVWVLSDN